MPILTPEERKKKILGRVAVLYGRSTRNPIERIKKDFENRYNAISASGNSAATERFLNLAEEICNQREDVARRNKNVIRQLAEIAKADAKPQSLDIAEYQRQLTPEALNLMGVGSIEDIQNYNSSIIHAAKLEQNSITQNSFSSIPGVGSVFGLHPTYRKKVELAFDQTLDAVDANAARLESLLENGRDISDAEKKELSSKRSNWSGLRTLATESAALLYAGVQQAGKGVISESKAVDSSYNEKYSKNKERFLAELMQKISADQSQYGFAMQKYLSRINSQNFDPLDALACSQMRDLILNEIEADKKIDAERIKQLNEQLEKLHDTMLTGMQKHEDESDEAWKYRVLSVFLIFTPLGAFSIGGQLFNYLDPLANIFGPIFDAHLSFSEGLSGVMTSKEFGFMGQAVDAMGIDDATQWLLDNTPFVNSACDVVDALMDSEIGQGIFAEVAPMLGSPLTLLGIAGVFTVGRAPAELDHSKGLDDSVKKHDTALKAAFDAFEKESKEGKGGNKKGSDARIEEFVNNQHELAKLTNIDLKMIEFLAKALGSGNGTLLESSKAFTGATFDCDGSGGKTLFQMFDVGKFSDSGKPGDPISAKAMIKFLSGFSEKTEKDFADPKAYEAFQVAQKELQKKANKFREGLRKEFVLLSGIDANLQSNGPTPSNIAELTRLNSATATDLQKKEAAEKLAAALKTFNQNFIFDQADRSAILNNRDVAEVAYLESLLKEKVVKKLKQDVTSAAVPSPIVRTESLTAEALHGENVFTPPLSSHHAKSLNSSASAGVTP